MLYYFLNHSGSITIADILAALFAYAIILLLVLPVHEFAHGLVAYWCGDKTAKAYGRLTLNPMKHLDMWGTIMILTVGIGYAKPVPVNTFNLRNRKRDMILIALAGPLSNFLMAVLAVGLFLLLSATVVTDFAMYSLLWEILVLNIAMINVSLMVFNLLPIPPLDGSRLWTSLLPGRWGYMLEQYSQYITMGLFILLMTNVLDLPLYYMRTGVVDLIFTIFGYPNFIA